MTDLPDTRESLLLRISDPADVEAWQEFAEIYRPAAYRMARRRGLQDADAEDLAQRVLVAISERIAQWRPARNGGSFRAWLSVVARNQIVNAITRRQPDSAVGGSSILQRLGNHPGRDPNQIEFEEECRRSLFRAAAAHIQDEFQVSTWMAFWLTAVDGLSTAAAAARLDKTEGVIYAGRSRVMRRLKEKVKELAEMRQSGRPEAESGKPP